jgi:F420-dependent oxidoreductase-like protein
MPNTPDRVGDTMECWTTLAALAASVPKLRVGTIVSGNTYRHPAVLAKMAAQVDVISGGRLTFGIGAGWWEPDYVGYGYEFGTPRRRLAQLAEAVQIILAMWTEDETTFEGEHYRVRGAVNQPKGVQRPHIPLMVAGGGEKVTLRLAARYADACNVLESPERLRHKFAVLREHCEQVGRDYAAVRRTTSTLCIIRDTDAEARALVPPGADFAFPGDLAGYGLVGTVDTVRERIAAYADAGVQELAVSFEDPTSEEQVREFAKQFIG